MDIQKIFLTGNLVADAEIRESEHGKYVTMKIACNINKDTANFYGVSMNHTGIADYLLKGKKVAVSGNLDIVSSINADGKVFVFRNVKKAEVCLM